MDGVLRGLAIYAVLVLLFRLTGKRSLAQATTFDLILLLIVSEATQQALLGEDFSITMAAIVIVTLLAVDRSADYLGYRFPRFDRLLESAAVILIDDGKVLHDRMRKSHIKEDEILTSARQAHGIESMDQIKFAVLEKSGGISVIPR